MMCDSHVSLTPHISSRKVTTRGGPRKIHAPQLHEGVLVRSNVVMEIRSLSHRRWWWSMINGICAHAKTERKTRDGKKIGARRKTPVRRKINATAAQKAFWWLTGWALPVQKVRDPNTRPDRHFRPEPLYSMHMHIYTRTHTHTVVSVLTYTTAAPLFVGFSTVSFWTNHTTSNHGNLLSLTPRSLAGAKQHHTPHHSELPSLRKAYLDCIHTKLPFIHCASLQE